MSISMAFSASKPSRQPFRTSPLISFSSHKAPGPTDLPGTSSGSATAAPTPPNPGQLPPPPSYVERHHGAANRAPQIPRRHPHPRAAPENSRIAYTQPTTLRSYAYAVKQRGAAKLVELFEESKTTFDIQMNDHCTVHPETMNCPTGEGCTTGSVEAGRARRAGAAATATKSRPLPSAAQLPRLLPAHLQHPE